MHNVRLYECVVAEDCATESATSYTARFGRESEDKLATLHLWLRHVGECESRKDKGKNVSD